MEAAIIIGICSIIAAISVPMVNAYVINKPRASIKGVSTSTSTNNGLTTWVDVGVENLKDIECSVVIYFSFTDGTALVDHNQNYRTYDGFVSVGKNFTPTRKEEVFTRLDLFIPFDELHLSKGTHRLSISISVLRPSSGRQLDNWKLTWEYTQY